MAALVASATLVGAELTAPQIDPGSGFVAAGQGTACTVDSPPVISVGASGYDAVWVNFRYQGATWRLPMTNGVTSYCLNMPVIPAGTIEYRIEAGTAFDPYSSTNTVDSLPVSGYYSYENTATLSNARKPNLVTWYDNKFYPGGYLNNEETYSGLIDNDWRAIELSMNPHYLILSGYEESQGQSYVDPALRSQASLLVGSIWFKARYKGNEGSGTLVIERSALPSFRSSHAEVETIQVPATTGWVQYRIDLNDVSGFYYRVRHPSGAEYGDANIDIKDIVFSPPVPDVVITKSMMEHVPGYPSRSDPVTFTISVTNVFAAVPALNISPKLVWRLNKGLTPGVWNTTPMSPIGGDQYQVTLPPLDPGDFQYYYRADFTGYAYTGRIYGPDTGSTQDEIVNLDEFSKWIDNNDNIAETRFPAYYPDFTDSQLYDLGVDPPVCNNDGSVLDKVFEPFSHLGFTVRRFRSKHNEVTLNIQDMSGNGLTIDPMYSMEQVGDYIWQSVIYMTNAAAEGINVDVGIAVQGTDRYEAPNTWYEAEPYNWLAIGQEDTAWNPPMAGVLNDDAPGGTPRLRVQIDYDGFMMFRFCTTNGNYEIRRAAWQDFNTWQALDSQDAGFTRSFGLYETTSFESDLDDFPESTMGSAGFTPFELGTTVSDDMLLSTYLNGITVDKAWVIADRERPPIPMPDRTAPNRALKLSAHPALLGSIETTSRTRTDGRDTLTFRVRASVDDDHRSYYRRGDAFENYIFEAKATTTSMSDGNASISVFGYYQDELNYIEGRLTQTTTLRTTSPDYYVLRMDLIHMKEGRETLLGTTTHGNNMRLTGTWTLKLKVVSSGGNQGTASFILNNGTTDVKSILDKAFTVDSLIPMGGTVGVNASDAATAFEVSMTDSASQPFSPDISKSTALNWYLGGRLDADSPSRWTFTSPSSKATLTRAIPAVKYRVNVYRDGTETNNVVAPVPTDTEDWDQDWDEFGTEDRERQTQSLAWQTVSVPMHLWDNVFIQIKPTGSDGALVVDDLDVNAWQGHTLYDEALLENDPHEELPWKATYAVRSKVNNNILYELNRTRANPVENQMIVSPLLVNGIGDLLFNYRVDKGNVTFSVQTLLINGAVDQTLLTTNVVAGSTIERMYVAALTNMTGRFRIIIDPLESSRDGILYIDNLKATDYPAVGDTSWAAYNLLISTYPWDPECKFDGAANTDYRSATINDGYANNTPLGVAYDEDEPYLQSPRIETGIGEVSFWYRRYPGATKPGKVYLKAAKNVQDFDNNPGAVLTLGVVDLNPDSETLDSQIACLENITNVTTDVWTYFSVEFYKADYKILRLYGDTETAGRVMVDNIIVTEPVRSSIDIESVELIPEIPLSTDKVGARVKLVNPRMNPTGIEVYLLYTIGTNQWGRENWSPSAASVKLDPVPGKPYEYVVADAIPQLPVDTVVQYTVEVVYQGTFASPVYYDEAFVNPSWYAPIDLNEQYADAGKSPYYYVFSVGTNVVFINEFLPYAYSYGAYLGLDEQYVELVGIDKGNVAGWKLEHVNVEASAYEDVVKWTNVLKPGAKFESRFVAGSQEPKDKGWGFYTLACSGVNSENPNFSVVSPNEIVVDQELFPRHFYNENHTGFAPGFEGRGMGVPGALCLRRSMGAYVQRIAWGSDTAVAQLLQRGYEYAGDRGTGANRRRRVFMWADNGALEPELAWVLLSESLYSPGYYNDGQAELIWKIDPAEEGEPTTKPEIGQPRITSIALGATSATLEFDVWTVNGVELANDNFTWYVETSEDPAFANPTAHPINAGTAPTPITAPSDGTPSSYSVDVDFGAPVSQSLFYRIKAVPRP
ncbi:MAG: hypothetical protein ACOX9C_00115 [Kiritimatiellia bacterium]